MMPTSRSRSSSKAALELVAVITMAVLIFGWFFVGCPLTAETITCRQKGKAVHRHTEYSVFGGGCLVETKDGLIPFSQWRSQ